MGVPDAPNFWSGGCNQAVK